MDQKPPFPLNITSKKQAFDLLGSQQGDLPPVLAAGLEATRTLLDEET